jgi:hypothetical protein
LFDRLRAAFRNDGVFMDVDGMRSGDDWQSEIEALVLQCDVVIVAIGNGWIDVAGESGGRRLDEPRDMVRFEIETALKGEKKIIPVLMNGAIMPRPDELPESIRRLGRLQAFDLRHSRYDDDVGALVEEIQSKLDEVAAVKAARATRERRRKETTERRYGLVESTPLDAQGGSTAIEQAPGRSVAPSGRAPPPWFRSRANHALMAGAAIAILALGGWYLMRNPHPDIVAANSKTGNEKGSATPSTPSQPDGMPCPTYAQGSYFRQELRAGFTPDPRTFEISAGGDLSLERCRPDMKGWVSREPHLALTYEGGNYPLIVEVRSMADTVLLINDADQQWFYDDDGAGRPNPRIRFDRPRQKRGRYDIWVGTYEKSDVKVPAQLIITER